MNEKEEINGAHLAEARLLKALERQTAALTLYAGAVADLVTTLREMYAEDEFEEDEEPRRYLDGKPMDG